MGYSRCCLPSVFLTCRSGFRQECESFTENPPFIKQSLIIRPRGGRKEVAAMEGPIEDWRSFWKEWKEHLPVT